MAGCQVGGSRGRSRSEVAAGPVVCAGPVLDVPPIHELTPSAQGGLGMFGIEKSFPWFRMYRAWFLDVSSGDAW